jgi:hypothetical protein
MEITASSINLEALDIKHKHFGRCVANRCARQPSVLRAVLHLILRAGGTHR